MESQADIKSKTRFLLLEGVHQNAVDTLKNAGYTNIEYIKTALDEDKLIEKIKDARFIGIRSRSQLTKKVIDAAERLAAIGCFCIGTNQVDLDAARQKGIPVFNAPYSNTRSVAELVIGQLILLLRGIPAKSKQVHKGSWPKSAKDSNEARGKTLGIVGYGSIGSQLSVTLHVPELESTKNMMAKAQFAEMKEGAIFMNAARGTCVKIEDLAEVIENGKLRGAAIDVFPTEPKSNDEPLDSPLRGFDNVILTPHIGGSTAEAQANIGLEVAEKFVQYANSGTTVSAVNFPNIAMPQQANTHRLLHIHHNQPGVLSNINHLFAEKNINILAQSLMTTDDVGYLVMDVADVDSEEAFNQLDTVEGTIRLRLLY